MIKRTMFRVLDPKGLVRGGNFHPVHATFDAGAKGVHVTRWLGMGRIEEVTIHLCRHRTDEGALACAACYTMLPGELVAEIRAGYEEQYDGPRHRAAVRKAVEFLRNKVLAEIASADRQRGRTGRRELNRLSYAFGVSTQRGGGK